MVLFLNKETEQLFNEDKKALYRVISIDRLIEILDKDKWAFVSPTMWNDPYEKAFIEAEYHHNRKKFFLPIKPIRSGENMQYSLFAMCWTETRESEAFWKTYTPNSDGVKITVWAKDLLAILKKIRDYDVYIGKACYESFEDLYSFKGDDEYWKQLMSKTINETHLKLMLKKRIPFNYEKEVRIILVRRTPRINSIAKVSIPDSKKFIHSYRFDPRMGSYMFKILRDTLVSQYHLPSIIRQSRLYAKPRGIINLIDEEE